MPSPNEPAFPEPGVYHPGAERIELISAYTGQSGMTIRTYLAAHARVAEEDITGMATSLYRIADPNLKQRVHCEAILKVRKADALIAELNKPVDEPAPAVAPPPVKPPPEPIPPDAKCLDCGQPATYRDPSGSLFCGACVPF